MHPSCETLDRAEHGPVDASYLSGYNPTMYTVRQTEEFVAWLDDLKDKRAQVRIAARLRQAESGSGGDW